MLLFNIEQRPEGRDYLEEVCTRKRTKKGQRPGAGVGVGGVIGVLKGQEPGHSGVDEEESAAGLLCGYPSSVFLISRKETDLCET